MDVPAICCHSKPQRYLQGILVSVKGQLGSQLLLAVLAFAITAGAFAHVSSQVLEGLEKV